MIHFRPCSCPPKRMTRIHRSAWMRLLFPSRALFKCGACGNRFLATLADQTDLGLRAHAEREQSKPASMQRDSAAAASPAA
jgi:hypothetical protein